MDKETLSNYGWIVICVLVLAVLLALASPFGNFIAGAIKSTTAGLFGVNQKVLNSTGLITVEEQTFQGDESASVVAGCATFTDGVTLTWEELKLAENGTKYGYNASIVNDVEISDETFVGCETLVGITFPNSITAIGTSSFEGCTSLTNVVFGNNGKLTYIGGGAFYGCESLASINIPNTITTICDSAFSWCAITTINIPNSVVTIEQIAFGDCPNLTTVTFEKNSKVTILDKTFAGSYTLSSVNLPASVVELNSPFQNCESLTAINFDGTIAQWNAINKDADWNYDSYINEIICSDGTVNLK